MRSASSACKSANQKRSQAFCPYYKWIMADTFWSLIFFVDDSVHGSARKQSDDVWWRKQRLYHACAAEKGKIGYVLGSLTSVYAVTFIETVLVLAADVMFIFCCCRTFAGSSAEFGEGYGRLFTYHVEWMYSKPFKLILFYIVLSIVRQDCSECWRPFAGLYFSNRFTVMFSGFIMGWSSSCWPISKSSNLPLNFCWCFWSCRRCTCRRLDVWRPFYLVASRCFCLSDCRGKKAYKHISISWKKRRKNRASRLLFWYWPFRFWLLRPFFQNANQYCNRE